jgi:hypothetical protein
MYEASEDTKWGIRIRKSKRDRQHKRKVGKVSTLVVIAQDCRGISKKKMERILSENSATCYNCGIETKVVKQDILTSIKQELSCAIPNGESESVNRRGTDNTKEKCNIAIVFSIQNKNIVLMYKCCRLHTHWQTYI